MDRRPVGNTVPRERGISLLLAALFTLLFIVPSAAALTVTPERQELTNPSEEIYQYVFTLTNDDDIAHALVLEPERNSAYLTNRITVDPQQFSLLPGDTRNIKVSISPSGLGPETHRLIIGAFENGVALETFEVLVNMPGTPVERYDGTINVEDITSEQVLPVELTLRNFGNVIGYAQARLEILRGDELVGQIDYPDLLQVVPNEDKTVTLTYTDHLEPGFYTARFIAMYPSTEVRSEEPFSVTLAATKQVVGLGEDLILTFASLGDPPAVVYALTDANGHERASGVFMPESGGITIPTSRLEPGEYLLSLRIRSTTRTIAVVVRDDAARYRIFAFLGTLIIVLVALYSLRRQASVQWRVLRLQLAIRKREREVNNLINRAHRLVDEYAAHVQRTNEAGTTGETRPGP